MKFIITVTAAIMAITVMAAGPLRQVRDLDSMKPYLSLGGPTERPDLSGPDVIVYENGITIKPLAPGGGLNVSTTRLHARENYCSLYFSCTNAYINIPAGRVLWSYYTVPYGSGAAIGGRTYGFNFNATGSTINSFGGYVGSFVRTNLGCLLDLQIHGCLIDVQKGAELASHNCLGYPTCVW
jgi:hypothetical protein